jgi:hypothetical protein
MRGSRRDIEHLRLVEDFLPEVWAQIHSCAQARFPTEHLRQFPLQGEERQSWCMPGFELHQNVYIAFGRKIIAQHRSEKRQPANMVATAEIGNLVFRYVNLRTPSRMLAVGQNVAGALH